MEEFSVHLAVQVIRDTCTCLLMAVLTRMPSDVGREYTVGEIHRLLPAYGVIGHNCILPEYRRRGFGKRQVREILRRLTLRGIRKARVSTHDHPFFLPARRMYAACGFVETERAPWDRDHRYEIVYYEKDL